MVKIEILPTYYKKVKPSYLLYFSEIFRQIMSFDELESKVNNGTTFSDPGYIDSAFLQESITFLRRSIFNLLGYRYLLTGNHLPMAKVVLYYSYFDSISSLLRLRGLALVHVSEVPDRFEDEPRKTKFKITKHENHNLPENF